MGSPHMGKRGAADFLPAPQSTAARTRGRRTTRTAAPVRASPPIQKQRFKTIRTNVRWENMGGKNGREKMGEKHNGGGGGGRMGFGVETFTGSREPSSEPKAPRSAEQTCRRQMSTSTKCIWASVTCGGVRRASARADLVIGPERAVRPLPGGGEGGHANVGGLEERVERACVVLVEYTSLTQV